MVKTKISSYQVSLKIVTSLKKRLSFDVNSRFEIRPNLLFIEEYIF